MLTTSDVIEKIKVLLEFSDTDLYDNQLEILIPGGFSKLKAEGIPNVLDMNNESHHDLINNYIICLSYQVAIDLDLDIDLSKLSSMYFNRSVTLREEVRAYVN